MTFEEDRAEAVKMVQRSAAAAAEGRELIRQSRLLMADAWDALPVGVVLKPSPAFARTLPWKMLPFDLTAGGWAEVGSGLQAPREWVREQFERGNLVISTDEAAP